MEKSKREKRRGVLHRQQEPLFPDVWHLSFWRSRYTLIGKKGSGMSFHIFYVE